MNWDAEAQRAINQKVVSIVPRHAWDSTTALAVNRQGAFDLHATAVLFQIDEGCFIVTAGHAVKESIRPGRTLGISTGTGGFIAVPKDWIVSADNQYDSIEDPFDIGLCRIPNDQVSRLSAKTFLTLSDVDFQVWSTKSVFTVFGFPGIWAVPGISRNDKLQLKPFEYTSYAYDEEVDALQGYQEKLHILIAGDPTYLSSPNGEPASLVDNLGNHASFPDSLHGMSGASVWRIGDLDEPIEDWSKRQPKVVAIETGAYKRRAVVATRWIAVTTLIHAAFPDLRASIEAWRQD